MKVCLVTAPTATEFIGLPELLNEAVLESIFSPPLGPLSLAAVLSGEGCSPGFINLNELYFSFVGTHSLDQCDTPRAFCLSRAFEEHAINAILGSAADVYAFSSICSTYPLTIRLAEAVKQGNPNCVVLFGGPQASVVDIQTLNAFPFVDFVLRGEAERTLPMFLNEMGMSGRFSSVPGLTHRTPFGPGRNGAAPVIEDLDALPLPAYRLAGDLSRVRRLQIEAGRGCPFECTFCSTNDFFRRRFRMKSPERLLDEMKAFASETGFRDFGFVHDMFTVDRRRVAAFCDYKIASATDYTWKCSARTDCIDEPLLDLMARAGCVGVFFGIESGSARVQKEMRKHLDPHVAKSMIGAAESRGMESTASLIVGFPGEKWEDVEDSIAIFVRSLSCGRSRPQMNLLAPLAETPLYSKHRGELVLDELCSDMSHQGRRLGEADLALIRALPEIFCNFYLIPTPHLERDAVLELCEFLSMTVGQLRWLAVAVHRNYGALLPVFFRWRAYRRRLYPEAPTRALREYYISQRSAAEFVEFLASVRNELTDPAAIALAEFHSLALASRREAARENRFDGTSVPGGDWRSSDHISLRAGVSVAEIPWDLERAIESLKDGGLALPAETYRDRTFVVRLPVSDDMERLTVVSTLAGIALQLSEFSPTLARFVETIGPELGAFDSVLRSRACLDLVKGLHAKGYVEIFRRPSSAFASQEISGSIPAYIRSSDEASARNQSLIQAE